MVSASTPFLRLFCSESAAEGGTYIEFVAFYECENAEFGTKDSVHVVQPPPPFQLALGTHAGPYRLVRISFKNGLWVRVNPAHSDTEVVDESMFDWSQVSGRWKTGEDIFDYFKRDKESWRQTGICPDPGFYEIQSSRWLDETGASDDRSTKWKHFLVLGHDSYAEVIAESFEILEGQVLAGW
jgi:hypothetical protein